MDWRANGEELKAKWRQRTVDIERLLETCTESTDALPPSIRDEVSFLRAAEDYAVGAPDELLEWLRPERELPDNSRDVLLALLSGSLKKLNARPRGRPPHAANKTLAARAMDFYRAWRTENLRAGISDYGHSDEMKGDSVRFIMELDASQLAGADAFAAQELMERPNYRRK